MSRIFCLARSVDVLEEVLTKGWQRSMRGLLPGNRAGLWGRTSGTSPGAQVTSGCHVSWSTEWEISVGSINPALTESSCRVFRVIRHDFEFAD
jgi:hypothetical protein